MSDTGTIRLSDKVVKAAAVPASGQALTWDSDVKGFALRVTANGARAFVLDYRLDGRKRRYTIGRYPDWSVAAARDAAKTMKRQVSRGDDPMADRDHSRTAPTVAKLWSLYERDHLPTKRDAAKDREMWDGYIKPALGRMKVDSVRRTDVREMHRQITQAGKPIRANRVLSLASKMFAMSVADYEMRADNPAKGIPRNPENKRARYLSQAEIARLSQALNKHPSRVAADAIRLILLTGCRRGEALSATWTQFDLERGIWTKPSAHTKQKKEHRVPLSAPAIQLLQDIRDRQPADEPHVFPGRETGEHLKSLKQPWTAIRERAGIPDVRLHDLRHSFASILVSQGLSLPLIGAMLGHTTPATTQRYAHLHDEPLREAAEAVGAVVGRGADSGQVVPFKRGQG